ncbi:MAG: hypothetical protein A2504_10495 [Bdellovibrionales bacterium RIFOXYD12_FULL_39_22]|nr:MAG: hypothetical protein A2385_17110 [Bdellovibrionales bacterium RIFOXYB1_FULL_39_21]OFZ44091.1 MAG: hypothetical protein A2485_14130 [Bdellovibrionales bacterium RIFOXYC12_FULL_39_17]OFZ48675.1 MAG: hypothetical protein A2404_08315 [Bdellovibrionales bacterium RIFOXYC1_FULL_39_130]OFZ76789.1 MAG: hypothetical protein A2560_10605 [Bdellovibrionales bacterium RIFOXYD1_FULL_39_84]OFZ95092.1 MAG: hypothetical protein A2504_10495 [Bdellovibrionales bacterium RIFOXYD12_FULL_39_22]HLE11030.1 hy
MYLYHSLPPNLTGTTLYPLNMMKGIIDDIFQDQAKKYEGREQLMQTKIPKLGCLWNDVLHFSPISFEQMYNALYDSLTKYAPENLKIKYPIHRKFLKIDSELLNQDNLCIFLNQVEIPTYNFTGFEDQFIIFQNEKEIIQIDISPTQIDKYNEAFQKGRRLLIYSHSPHVFYKGYIELEKFGICNFSYYST